MAKFDLYNKRDDLVIQERLDWIGNDLICVPGWVWNAAVRSFEKDFGLPNGFINGENFPDLSYRKPKISLHDLRKQLSAGDTRE